MGVTTYSMEELGTEATGMEKGLGEQVWGPLKEPRVSQADLVSSKQLALRGNSRSPGW